jgi:uncharacterized lipoprotein YmbA
MKRATLVSGAALLACALGACGTTPPSRFYALEPLPEAAHPGADTGGLSVNVGPVIIAEGLDRAQMVTRLGPNQLDLHEYERWSEPLDENILRVLAENLSVVLGTQRIGTIPDSETHESSWLVTVNVLTFEVGTDGNATLAARWRLYRPGEDAPSATHKSVLVAPLPSKDGAGIAAAMSSNLAALARDIAKALQGG